MQKIDEIKELLLHITSEQDERFQLLCADERKGVQKLLMQWRKKKEHEAQEHASFLEKSKFETQLRTSGVRWIAGVDEVGRGPLAGPVVAAAVMLPVDFYLLGLNDSKKLSEAKREQFYEYISEHAHVGVGVIEPVVIDEINIYEATKQAMQEAIAQLPIAPEHLLIDAMKLPLPTPQTSIIKGDMKSISIAAASVIAKVTRDRMMKEMDVKYPQYGFARHMGYGTKEHLQALQEYGVLAVHRKSFAPIKDM